MKLPPIIFTVLVITTVTVGIVFTQQKERSTMEQDSTLRKKVLWEKATEMPFTGIFDDFFEEGTYYCAGCGAELFSSSSKYNSGCGWPAFSEAMKNGAVEEQTDYSHGMVRTEVHCKKCKAHLGHVFNDGPRPTGLRYCINSVSLDFKPKTTAEKK